MIDGLIDKEVGSGATKDIVETASQLLEVDFPEDYKEFLCRYGWARLSYEEFYGLGDSVPEHLNLVKNTIHERTRFHPHLPKYLVPVLADGAGNHYCLDLSQATSVKCPVVFWDHDQDDRQAPELVGNSFSEWVVKHVSNQ